MNISGVPTCTQIRMCVQLGAARIGFSVTLTKLLTQYGRGRAVTNIVRTCGPTQLRTWTCKQLQYKHGLHVFVRVCLYVLCGRLLGKG